MQLSPGILFGSLFLFLPQVGKINRNKPSVFNLSNRENELYLHSRKNAASMGEMDKGVSTGNLGYTAKNGALMPLMVLWVVVAGVWSMKYAASAGLGLDTDLRTV